MMPKVTMKKQRILANCRNRGLRLLFIGLADIDWLETDIAV
jgi:hypothetical protein